MPSEGAHSDQPRPQARDYTATQHGTTHFISFLLFIFKSAKQVDLFYFFVLKNIIFTLLNFYFIIIFIYF